MSEEWTDMEMEIATDEMLALVDDLEAMSRDIKKMGGDSDRAEPLVAADLLRDAAAAVRGAAMQVSILRGSTLMEEDY